MNEFYTSFHGIEIDINTCPIGNCLLTAILTDRKFSGISTGKFKLYN